MDEITPVPVVSIEHVDFMQETERILLEVKETRNFDAGFEFINDLYDKGQTFAKAVGFMLEGMSEFWIPSEHDGETFNQAAKRQTKLAQATIRNHIKIQKALESDCIPDEFRPYIEEMGQKEVIQVAELINRQLDISHDDWKRLTDAADEREVGRIARQIKGVAPRSNYLAITMNEDGELWEHTSNGSKPCGRFYVEDKDPDVQKAITRLSGCGGIIPSVKY